MIKSVLLDIMRDPQVECAEMRKAEIIRKTSETNISVKINLDGSGKTSLSTGLPFWSTC